MNVIHWNFKHEVCLFLGFIKEHGYDSDNSLEGRLVLFYASSMHFTQSPRIFSTMWIMHPPNPTLQTPLPYAEYTFLIPYSYTTHIYVHDSGSPQNLVTSKGSLWLPMCLSTRLLVACKSRELKKTMWISLFKKQLR